MLSVLHFPDLRIGAADRFIPEDFQQWAQSLTRKLSEIALPAVPDGPNSAGGEVYEFEQLVVSGEITRTGAAKAFDNAKALLTGLARYLFPHARSPEERVFLVPGSRDAATEEFDRFFTDFSKPESGFVCCPEKRAWVRTLSQATLLARVPGQDPARAATFFREQLEGHAFITYRPVVLVSGVDPAREADSHRHLVDELHKLVDRIWVLSPAGWSLSQKSAEVKAASGDFTITHRSWRDRGEQFWPLVAGALVLGCDGDDPKRAWVALSKADAAAEWTGSLVLTPVDVRPPSQSVPADEEAQVYRP
jgi:hypothetical protein